MTPIWKDIFVDLQSSQTKEPYTISVDGSVVYAGVSYGIDTHTIRINDVIADYFLRKHPALSNGGASGEKALINVEVRNNSGLQVFSDVIIPDYSYVNMAYSENAPYAPIDKRIDRRMPFVGTIYDALGREVYFDNSKQVLTTPFGDTFSLSIPDGVDVISVGGHSWEVVDGCDKYALYYTNAFGGWDFLLCSGRPSETKSYTRHETKIKYDNRTPSARGVDNWVNEESRSIAIRTGFVGDQGSKNISHLIGSPNVYLYDLETAELRAVTITDTSAEERSYMGNGAKPIQYTINVTLAQDFIRR